MDVIKFFNFTSFENFQLVVYQLFISSKRHENFSGLKSVPTHVTIRTIFGANISRFNDFNYICTNE